MCSSLTLQQIYKLTEHHHDDWITGSQTTDTLVLLQTLKRVVDSTVCPPSLKPPATPAPFWDLCHSEHVGWLMRPPSRWEDRSCSALQRACSRGAWATFCSCKAKGTAAASQGDRGAMKWRREGK